MYAILTLHNVIYLLNEELDIVRGYKPANYYYYDTFSIDSSIYHSQILSPAPNKLIICKKYRGIKFFDVSKASIISKSSSTCKIGIIFSICLLSHNRLAAAGYNQIIYVLDENGNLLHILEPLGGCILCLLYIEETDALWASDREGNIYIIDDYMQTQSDIHKIQQILHKRGDFVYALENRGINRTIFSAGSRGRVGGWGYEGELLFSLHLGDNTTICSSCIYEENKLVIGDESGYIKVWIATVHDQAQISQFRPFTARVKGRSIQQVGDSQLFLVASSRHETLKLIDPIRGKIIKESILSYNIPAGGEEEDYDSQVGYTIGMTKIIVN